MNNDNSNDHGDMYGNVPTIDPMTAGRGSEMVDGINVVKSIPMDQVQDYGTKTPVPTYRGD